MYGWKEQEKTSLFSLKKETWIEGPELPKIVIATIASNKLMCVTTLNRTSTLFIGIGKSMQEVISYDFEKDSWIQLEDTPKKIQWCTASSAHTQ